MRTFAMLLFSLTVLFLSCKDGPELKVEDAQKGDVRDSIAKPLLPIATVKVAAHLVYEDGTLSGFDVLNDKSVVLWNAIIGGGDALKASNSTMVSLNLKIVNGRKLVIDTLVVVSNKEMRYIVKKTGCDEVYINVTKSNKVIYNDTIPFRCGE